MIYCLNWVLLNQSLVIYQGCGGTHLESIQLMQWDGDQGSLWSLSGREEGHQGEMFGVYSLLFILIKSQIDEWRGWGVEWAWRVKGLVSYI